MTNSIYIHIRDEASNILEVERLNYLPWLVLVVLHTFPLLSSPQLSCTWQLEALVPLALSIAHWHCLQSPVFVLSQAATQQWTHKATRRRHEYLNSPCSRAGISEFTQESGAVCHITWAILRFPARSFDSRLDTAVMPRYMQSKWTFKSWEALLSVKKELQWALEAWGGGSDTLPAQLSPFQQLAPSLQ